MSKFTNFVAWRYMKADRYNPFFSWISMLTVIGIGISVAAVICVISVFEGFQTELRDRFLHANAHILAYRYPGGMAKPDRWREVLEKDFGNVLTGTAPFIHHETMAKKGSIMHSVLVRGIIPDEREKVQAVGNLVRPVSAMAILQSEVDHPDKPVQYPSIIAGVGLIKLMDAKIGDLVSLIPPKDGDVRGLQQFKIVGVYDSGFKHYDNKLIVMSIPAAQKFFEMPGLVTGLEVGLKSPENSVGIAENMSSKYSLSIQEWQSFNKPMLDTINREKYIIFLIVMLIMLVAAFNILTTTFVAVTQKQRDISVLKAIGARNNQILSIFIKQGLYLGSIGSLLGAILALTFSKILEHFEIVKLPDPYFLDRLPVHYSPAIYAGISILAVVISMLAGLYPAYVAAKIQPTEGIAGVGKAG